MPGWRRRGSDARLAAPWIAAGQDRFARRCTRAGGRAAAGRRGRRADVVPPKGLDDVSADGVQYGHGRRPSALPLARRSPETAGDGDTFVDLVAAAVRGRHRRRRPGPPVARPGCGLRSRPTSGPSSRCTTTRVRRAQAVTYVDHDEVVDVSEVAVFLGPGFARHGPAGWMDVLDRFRRDLDAGDPELLAVVSNQAVLYRPPTLVVDGYESAIESINEEFDAIESLVFDSTGSDGHPERIYKLKREVAEFPPRRPAAGRPAAAARAGTVPGVGDAVMPTSAMCPTTPAGRRCHRRA